MMIEITESQFLPSAGCDEAPRAGSAEEEPKYITPYTPTGVNPEWSKERDESERADYVEETLIYISPYTPTGINPEWLKMRGEREALYVEEARTYISPYTPTGFNPEWLKRRDEEGMCYPNPRIIDEMLTLSYPAASLLHEQATGKHVYRTTTKIQQVNPNPSDRIAFGTLTAACQRDPEASRV